MDKPTACFAYSNTLEDAIAVFENVMECRVDYVEHSIKDFEEGFEIGYYPNDFILNEIKDDDILSVKLDKAYENILNGMKFCFIPYDIIRENRNDGIIPYIDKIYEGGKIWTRKNYSQRLDSVLRL